MAWGVRRKKAITGLYAYQYNAKLEKQLKQLEVVFECPCCKILEKYQRALDQKKQFEAMYRQSLQKDSSNVVQKQQAIDGLNCVQFCLQTIDMNTLRSLGKSYFTQNKVDVLWAAGENDGKGFVLVFCSDKAIAQHKEANALIQGFLNPLGANGGGKTDFATGGIKDVAVLKTHWGKLSF